MKRNRPNWVRLFQYTANGRRSFAGIILSAAAVTAASLYAPVIIGRAVDSAVGAGRVNFGAVAQAVAWLSGLYLLNALAGWILQTLAVLAATQTVRNMRDDAFRKLNALPVSFFDKAAAGELMSRFSNDIDLIADGLLQGFSQFFTALFAIVGAMALMLSIDIAIALAVLVVTPLALCIAGFIGKRSRRLFRRQQDTIGDYNDYLEEMLGGFGIVKAFCRERKAMEESGAINRRLYVYGQKARFYASLVNPTARFVNYAAYVGVGCIGGLSAIGGGLSIGMLSALLSYAAQFSKPLNDITGIWMQIQAALAAAERFFQLMDVPEQADESAKPALKVAEGGGEIIFQDVSFGYDGGPPLISGLNLDVKPGELVAIVGPTGAGKTTLVNLLMRFYELNGGTIRIDGVDTAGVQSVSVRRCFGMVLQDTWLFSGTIRENIAYGNPSAAEEEIVAAAKAARAHGFIMRTAQGYDTPVSGDGENLSQGEKQLLTIARAMLAKPPFMILDEATSSVDTRTETKIQEALARLMKGRTSFMIAHRLSTMREADKILVMDRGRIVEQGNHAELIAARGLYYRMLKSKG